MPIQLRRMEGYGNQTVCRKGLMAKKSHAYTSQKQMRQAMVLRFQEIDYHLPGAQLRLCASIHSRMKS